MRRFAHVWADAGHHVISGSLETLNKGRNIELLMITEEVYVPYIEGLTARLMLGRSQMSADHLKANDREQRLSGGG